MDPRDVVPNVGVGTGGRNADRVRGRDHPAVTARGDMQEPVHEVVVTEAVLDDEPRLADRRSIPRIRLVEVWICRGGTDDRPHTDVRAAELLGDVAPEVLRRDDPDGCAA